MNVIKMKVKNIGIVFPLSIVVITMLAFLTPNFKLRAPIMEGIMEIFTIVIFFYIFSSLLYAIPTTVFTEYILKKIPAGKRAYKFILYIFWPFLYFIALLFPLFGMSVFAFVPFLFLYLFEELRNKIGKAVFFTSSLISTFFILAVYILTIFNA